MKISIIIKALNEERNVARCIESAMAALDRFGGDGEIILADSLSTDRTVEIARAYPVRVVQLVHAEDRCCGVGADLGYRVATGDYLYILDADMELGIDFLPAAVSAFESDATLGGVGGRIEEMHVDNAEFRGRAAQKLPHFQPGSVDRLNMGGLYRRVAVQPLGYLTNRNLHSFEEYELGARLRASGWTLRRIDTLAAKHYGHTDSSLKLLLRRWRTRYAWGVGELLRESIGQPHLGLVVREVRLFKQCLVVYGWWSLLLACVFLAVVGLASLWWLLPVVAAPFMVAMVKRGSWADGLYVVVFNNLYALGLLAGLFAKRRGEPATPPPLRQYGGIDG